jgi:hypothetical protein
MSSIYQTLLNRWSRNMYSRAFIPAAIAAMALCLVASPSRAQTASATVCADGTTSTAVGKDLCVGHGGVKAKSTSSVETHVTCKDGTVAEAGKGACADRGGVRSKTSTTRTHTITKTKGAEDTIATNAIAICKDGKYSHAELRANACTTHGGVSRYLKP